MDFVEPDIDKVTALIFTPASLQVKLPTSCKSTSFQPLVLFFYWLHKYRQENDTQEQRMMQHAKYHKTYQSLDLVEKKLQKKQSGKYNLLKYLLLL